VRTVLAPCLPMGSPPSTTPSLGTLTPTSCKYSVENRIVSFSCRFLICCVCRWVDQPAGVGFSYGAKNDHNETMVRKFSFCSKLICGNWAVVRLATTCTHFCKLSLRLTLSMPTTSSLCLESPTVRVLVSYRVCTLLILLL
jgi:hypothetical protein